MIFAIRDATGRVISLHSEALVGTEGLPNTHPDVLRFLGQDQESRQFASLDAGLVRVLEDLIDALIRRNVLNITDLPMEAQLKLFDRKHFREGMSGHALNLYENSPQGRAEAIAAAPDWGDSRYN